MYRRLVVVVDMVHPERAEEGIGEGQVGWVLVQPQGRWWTFLGRHS